MKGENMERDVLINGIGLSKFYQMGEITVTAIKI